MLFTMSRSYLTDHQLWVLVNAHDSLSDETLAQSFGAKVSTVHAARWRLRRHGLTCAVSYGVCSVCGETFTRQGHKAGRRAYHPECRSQVLKQLNAGYDDRRWQVMPAEKRHIVLDRAHEHTRHHQRKSLHTATNRGLRWQAWEDDFIRENPDLSTAELARELGRTLYAVTGRKRKLRRPSETMRS